MADLLPCPFCGAQPAAIIRDMDWHDIVCHGLRCAVVVRAGAATRERAIAAWNRRASPPVPARTRFRVFPWRDCLVIKRRHVRRTARPS